MTNRRDQVNAANMEPEAEFVRLLGERVHPPVNVEARLRGGFSRAELAGLGLV